VPSIVGFGKAAEIARNNTNDMKRVSRMVETIAGNLTGSCNAVRNGDPVNRLPHILSLTFPRLPGAPLVGELSRKGVCVSMGSACRARKQKSHVLEAMGLDHVLNNHTIRISLSRYTEDIDAMLFIQAIQQVNKDPKKLEYL
jgi:cysteine desulfurase